jgi:uncharacterized membrane protein
MTTAGTEAGSSAGRQAALLLGGFGAGAALMYALDPVAGRRRRALARDQVVHLGRVSEDALSTLGTDLRNRARGLQARASSLATEEPVSDTVLAERVREALGHVVSHPRAIEVEVRDGCAVLRGPILAAEADRLLRRAARVRGVRDVRDQLERHQTAGDVPALQGGSERTGARFEFFQERWAPSARLLAAAAGTALVGWGIRRNDGLGWALGLGGAAMLARTGTNQPLARLAGGDRAGGIRLQQAVTVGAPVGRVFEFWSHPENFPSFMRDVRAVSRLGEGRSHWVVEAPGGTTVEWDAETTQIEPERLIAWRTVPGSTIEHSGEVRFEPSGAHATRVRVHLRYDPPAGGAGDVVATVLGANPRRRLDEDLASMRQTIERGMPPRDAMQEGSPPGSSVE